MAVENVRSPQVLAAIKLLEQLLAGGEPVPSKLVREHAARARIPEPALRVAKGHLGITAEPRFGPNTAGHTRFAEWVWRLPASLVPPAPTTTPEPAPSAAPPPAIDKLSPEALAQCVRINGQLTHPLGDDEFQRLRDGGQPLPTPADEPWLWRRR